MTIKKSPYYLALLCLPLLLLGFGCKGLSTAEQEAMTPVTLEYWTVYDDVDALQALINQYTGQRPYLTVNLRQLRPAEVYTRLVEALSEDKGPDIISVNNHELGVYLSKLAPMPASVKDTRVIVEKTTLGTNTTVFTSTNPMITLSQLDKEYVQAVKKDVARDGNIYGLPLSLDTMAIYYNKDLLDRAGVAEPPKTWEEFQVAVKKITKYDKASGKVIQSGAALGTGNNIPNADDLLSVLFKQSGVDMAGGSGQAAFNAQPQGGDRGAPTPGMSVVNFYTDFANPNRETYSWGEEMGNALDAFVSGKVGFFFGYSYHNSVISARAPQLNYRIMPLLQLNPEQPVNVANYWVQTVIAKSKHQNEAWALIDYLTHSTATKDYLTQTSRPTAARSVIAAQKEKLELEPFVSQVLIADNWYRGDNYVSAATALKDMLHEWLGTPPSDPNQIWGWRQEILNRAAAKIDQTL